MMKDRGKKQKGVDAPREDLVRELRHLRGVVRDVCDNMVLREEGEIESLISNILALPPGKLKSKGGTWLRELQSMKVKPEKGRLKDLREIQHRVEGILTEVTSTLTVKSGRRKSAAAVEEQRV
ncbi:MAG TPA: hypothetical protein VNX25_01610 [Verrucomicrobiae bacterium]|nr:hypothetical protein [Verrucomicrobiae bacterium]